MILHPDRIKSRINQSICDRYHYRVYWKSQQFTELVMFMMLTTIKFFIRESVRNENEIKY